MRVDRASYIVLSEQMNNPIACEYPIDTLKQLHDTKVLSQGHTKDENADEKNIMFHIPCFYKHSMGPNSITPFDNGCDYLQQVTMPHGGHRS